jgi:hypothetical protein
MSRQRTTAWPLPAHSVQLARAVGSRCRSLSGSASNASRSSSAPGCGLPGRGSSGSHQRGTLIVPAARCRMARFRAQRARGASGGANGVAAGLGLVWPSLQETALTCLSAFALPVCCQKWRGQGVTAEDKDPAGAGSHRRKSRPCRLLARPVHRCHRSKQPGASRSQCEGRGFDSLRLHHAQAPTAGQVTSGLMYLRQRPCRGALPRSRQEWRPMPLPRAAVGRLIRLD